MPSSPRSPSESEHQVLPFRRRGAGVPRPSPPQDLSRFERPTADEPDDFRHRMVMNGMAALLLVLLIAAGWWIADTMASVRKTQDCAMAGRRNCEKIQLPVDRGAPLPNEKGAASQATPSR